MPSSELLLDQGWEAASCPPDAPPDAAAIDALDWMPARVPGTAAAALRDAGGWAAGDPHDFDAEDWWFRTRFAVEPTSVEGELTLALDGVATVYAVYLDGTLVHEGDSMFAVAEIDIGGLLAGDERTTAELAIRCRALAPLLRERRKPRARWRTRLAEGALRFQRTMLLGRAPGIAPGPAAVGPWRPVRLVRRHGVVVEPVELRTSLDGDDGVLAVRAGLRALSGAVPSEIEVELSGPSGDQRVALAVEESATGGVASGTLRVPGVARWWPHTHGEPVLYAVRLLVSGSGDQEALEAGRVGFRNLAPGPAPGHDVEADGLDLHVNGVRVFARGAVWTPADPVGLAPSDADLRTTLERVRDAGMNMLRIPGTGAYESAAFHDLCDELGILVWQDFMFANLDYPVADEGFRATVEREARQQLAALAGRPSLAVLCGNSEVEQQAAMMGLEPSLGRGELFGELLPQIVAEAEVDAPYLPSAPCGGELPFRPDRGVVNYFGVGGYRRPLSDARTAGVRFASECLAFSNVADEGMTEELLGTAATGPALEGPGWKDRVPRDAGAGWDFEDVRDHYLGSLFEVDPAELRRDDPRRYLELSRTVSGEVMAAVFGEWRRAASPCGGGLVLWLRDLAPGAGWGVLDCDGSPKVAYHHLRRALAPTAVWMTDEGLGGVDVHLAHDGTETLAVRLRVTLYRDFEQRVGEVVEEIELGSHSAATRNVEGLLGRFVDASWAYRFGPPAQSLVVASLERDGEAGVELLSQAVNLPAGRPREVELRERLGFEAGAEMELGGAVALSLSSRRFVYGLRIHAPGYRPEDDAISLEPGVRRQIVLRPQAIGADAGIELSALNMQGRLAVDLGRP